MAGGRDAQAGWLLLMLLLRMGTSWWVLRTRMRHRIAEVQGMFRVPQMNETVAGVRAGLGSFARLSYACAQPPPGFWI